MQRTYLTRGVVSLGLFVALAAAFGCSGGGKGGPPGGGFAVQVVIEQADVRNLPQTIHAVGTLVAEQAIDVVAQHAGQVEAIGFVEGARVGQGDVLFDVDFKASQAQADSAAATFALAKANRDRTRKLNEAGAVSPQALEEAESRFVEARAAWIAARRRFDQARIEAPFAGVAGKHLIHRGQIISPGTKLTRLIDDDPIEVEFYVPERYLSALALRQAIEVEPNAPDAVTHSGTVVFIAPEVDTETRSVLVKAATPNPDAVLRPGMLVDVTLVHDIVERAVMIPEAAVSRTAAGPTVFVVVDGKAQRRNVETGARLPGLVHIVKGVADGESVIVDGIQKVRPGAAVNPVTEAR